MTAHRLYDQALIVAIFGAAVIAPPIALSTTLTPTIDSIRITYFDPALGQVVSTIQEVSNVQSK